MVSQLWSLKKLMPLDIAIFGIVSKIMTNFYSILSKLLQKIQVVQVSEYKKELEYRLHHTLSNFDRCVFLILKLISYFLA